MMRLQFLFFIILVQSLCHGTLPLMAAVLTDTTVFDSLKFSDKDTPRFKHVALPAAAFLYGIVTLDNNQLKKLDEEAKHTFYSEHPHKQFVVDDYLQFAPGGAVFALNALGVKGRNKVLDQAGIYLVSNIVLNLTTQGFKRWTNITRPDGTPYAFPSGHAAEAFASAEFLRREYGDQSVWYTISGYSAATAVAALRMYNNRHWFSDVIAGAGVGVLSTQAAYWLYPKIREFISPRNKNAFVYPYYAGGNVGAGFSIVF